MCLRECAETVKQVQVKNRRCGYTNKAQTIMVWAFSNWKCVWRGAELKKIGKAE